MALLNSRKTKNGLLTSYEKMGLDEVGTVRPSRTAQMIEGTTLGTPKMSANPAVQMGQIEQAKTSFGGVRAQAAKQKKKPVGWQSFIESSVYRGRQPY